MKKKRFTVEHIAGILKQAELGAPIAELCRQHGVSEQSYYRWKRLYGAMEPSEVRELKLMRDESAKLKRIVADLSLDKARHRAAAALSDPLSPATQGTSVRAIRSGGDDGHQSERSAAGELPGR